MGQRDKGFERYISERHAAACEGVVDAYYDLGLLYATGQGVSLDLIEAHKWFNLAALSGMKRAMVDRSELARDMSGPEIAKAQREAREWMTAH